MKCKFELGMYRIVHYDYGTVHKRVYDYSIFNVQLHILHNSNKNLVKDNA